MLFEALNSRVEDWLAEWWSQQPTSSLVARPKAMPKTSMKRETKFMELEDHDAQGTADFEWCEMKLMKMEDRDIHDTGDVEGWLMQKEDHDAQAPSPKEQFMQECRVRLSALKAFEHVLQVEKTVKKVNKIQTKIRRRRRHTHRRKESTTTEQES